MFDDIATSIGDKWSPRSHGFDRDNAEIFFLRKHKASALGVVTREILFRDSMRKTPDPEMRAKAEAEYLVDRQRINDDCERAIEGIRKGTS